MYFLRCAYTKLRITQEELMALDYAAAIEKIAHIVDPTLSDADACVRLTSKKQNKKVVETMRLTHCFVVF